MRVGDSNTVICEPSSNRAVPLFQRYPDLGDIGGILDRIVEKDQEELMKESLIPRVSNLSVQFPHDSDIFCASARTDQGTSFFKNLVDVKRLAHQVQLSSIGHGERKQAFHDARQLLELVVKHVEGLLIVLRTPWFGEQQFSLSVKHREWRAKAGVGHRYKLARLGGGAIYVLQEVA